MERRNQLPDKDDGRITRTGYGRGPSQPSRENRNRGETTQETSNRHEDRRCGAGSETDVTEATAGSSIRKAMYQEGTAGKKKMADQTATLGWTATGRDAAGATHQDLCREGRALKDAPGGVHLADKDGRNRNRNRGEPSDPKKRRNPGRNLTPRKKRNKKKKNRRKRKVYPTPRKRTSSSEEMPPRSTKSSSRRKRKRSPST